MRLTGLLALLIFILIVFFAAPAASFAQSANTIIAPKPSEHPEMLLSMDGTLVDRGRHGRFGSEFERDGVCYTMRTYIMAREDQDSDATRMVRATRCLPAWKLEFKTAVTPMHQGKDDTPLTR
jgi:hypothetical protein